MFTFELLFGIEFWRNKYFTKKIIPNTFGQYVYVFSTYGLLHLLLLFILFIYHYKFEIEQIPMEKVGICLKRKILRNNSQQLSNTKNTLKNKIHSEYHPKKRMVYSTADYTVHLYMVKH